MALKINQETESEKQMQIWWISARNIRLISLTSNSIAFNRSRYKFKKKKNYSRNVRIAKCSLPHTHYSTIILSHKKRIKLESYTSTNLPVQNQLRKHLLFKNHLHASFIQIQRTYLCGLLCKTNTDNKNWTLRELKG